MRDSRMPWAKEGVSVRGKAVKGSEHTNIPFLRASLYRLRSTLSEQTLYLQLAKFEPAGTSNDMCTAWHQQTVPTGNQMPKAACVPNIDDTVEVWSYPDEFVAFSQRNHSHLDRLFQRQDRDFQNYHREVDWLKIRKDPNRNQSNE